jgi:hypothetical protein
MTRRRLVAMAKAFALTAAVSHVVLTALYNLPHNPMRQALRPLLDPTIGMHFSQNWRLFAPNPATSDLSLLVGCIDEPTLGELQGRAATGEKVRYEGQWRDLTAPLWAHHQGNRFSAYDRLSRPQNNGVRTYMQAGGDVELWGRACRQGDQAACEQLELQLEGYRHVALASLVRVASSYCHATAPASAAVALRVREKKAVPWSKRHDGTEPEVADGDLGVFPIVSDVMPAHFYGQEG